MTGHSIVVSAALATLVVLGAVACSSEEDPMDAPPGGLAASPMTGGMTAPTMPTAGAPDMPAPGNTGMPAAMPTSGAPVDMTAGTGTDTPVTNPSQGGSGGTPSTETVVDCTITPSVTMSPAISTVGTVEFTTDLQGIDAAYIEFGLDEGYGMQAPVDLQEPGYRTLLLGMKTSREYHYRVVAMAGAQMCVGDDNTLETGPPPNQPRLLGIDIETPQPDKLNGGFTISGHFPTGPAFIIDGDGDYVWWFDSGDATSVRMSYDGKYMWIRNSNVNGRDPMIRRVSMDGTEVEEFGLSSEFGDSHHDFTVLPDETIIFIAHDSGGCDKIMERSPDGQVHEIINSQEATGSGSCHLNAVHYYAEDDTVTFSDRIPGSYVKVTREGEVVWVLGGSASTFTSGNGLDWGRGGQHGHHVLAPDRMLMFANGSAGGDSMAYELMLDESTGTVTRTWEYNGGEQTPVLGDVQRLPNGNTLVVYTTRGTMHEVDPDGNLVQSMVWGLGGATTYIQRRPTLYGPPPR